MQTPLNIPRVKFRRRQFGVRRIVLFVVFGVIAGGPATACLATGQTQDQTSQLPGWEAPEINSPTTSKSPSNYVRPQIGLPSSPESTHAGSNAPISLPTQPLSPSLAPVHAPIQTQPHVQMVAFETETPEFAQQTPPAITDSNKNEAPNPTTHSSTPASGFSESPITADGIAAMFNKQASEATSKEGIWASIKVGLLLAVLSLAPAIVLMTTCYVRVVVVLTLLRQAFGGQQLPPMQVITALSLFLTMLIMAPVWNEVKTEAIDPYTREQSPISWEEAWQRGIEPVKHFMVSQIKASGNSDSVAVFYKHLPDAGTPPTTLEQVPVNVLLPAFLISELKIAFLLGFQIFLPFLVLDLVVSSVTVSSGMMMLPPTMVSFPLKLILFVMVDGWNLVVGMLLQSFSLG